MSQKKNRAKLFLP